MIDCHASKKLDHGMDCDRQLWCKIIIIMGDRSPPRMRDPFMNFDDALGRQIVELHT